MKKNIEFLEKKGFEKIDNIEDLKTSRGQVEFFKKSEKYYGKSSKTTTPDLRYFWDGERFGLHVSDSNFESKDLIQFLSQNPEIASNINLLYLGRTDLQKFSKLPCNFSKLKYLYLSENANLNYIEISDFPSLINFYAANCPTLYKVVLTGDFKYLKSIDLSFCVLEEVKFENLNFLENLNLSNNKLHELKIDSLSNLQYLFALGNPILKILWSNTWVLEKLKILGLNESNELISKDILEIAKNSSDNELQERLKAYLNFEQKHEDEL